MQTAHQHLEKLKQVLQPIRNELIQHPIYHQLQTLEQLQLFSTYHVFAVWDFMSLLKSLQNNLTSTSMPWKPVGNANTRYLINEIVLGEESDIDEVGNRTSHFELYLKAMQQMGADTMPIQQFLMYINNQVSVKKAMQQLQLPNAVQDFVNATFYVIENEPIHAQAAVFTFGREDLIPEMFIAMVKDLQIQHHEKVATFKYYLERHIEVDGDHHSHLATEMVSILCGDDAEKWQEATNAAIVALEMRKKLWNAIWEKINHAELVVKSSL